MTGLPSELLPLNRNQASLVIDVRLGWGTCSVTFCWLIGSIVLLAVGTVSAQQGRLGAGQENDLTYARRLIRETPCPGRFHNPLRVIRSVNSLYSLGKARAISLLLEISSPDLGPVVVDPEDDQDGLPEHNPHDQIVCMIVPLLFRVSKEGVLPPETWYCERTRTWCGAAGTQVVQGDIPFAVSGEWNYAGRPRPTRPLVEWAAKHGEMRTTKLHPQGDPLQAADTLCQRVSRALVVEFEVLNHGDESARSDRARSLQTDLRAQAIRMLPEALQDSTNLTWDELRKKVSGARLYWDPTSESYRQRQGLPEESE